jgi:hypothetical protein
VTRRLRSYAWLWLLVAVQVAIPASYYLRSSDLEDERFAWRMFSDVRLMRCRVRASVLGPHGRTDLSLGRTLHSSWIHGLERGRRRVIERYLSSRCAPAVQAAVLDRSCADVRATRVPRERYIYDCSQGTLRLHREGS